MTQPLTTDQIEELLEEWVPCGGIKWTPIARKCDNEAVLRRHGHACRCANDGDPAALKCISCWQIWYRYQVDLLTRCGHIRCSICKTNFSTVEAFADYRPF